MEIYHQYVRQRRNFGRHAKFVDGGAEMLADIRPNSDHAAACVVRNPVTTATQCVPDMSEHEANTTAVIYASKAMSHREGGWPKDVDPTEAEHTIRCASRSQPRAHFQVVPRLHARQPSTQPPSQSRCGGRSHQIA